MKKFTENHAVDVRGWDKLTYGKVMFETIKRVGGHGDKAVNYTDINNECNQLVVVSPPFDTQYDLTHIDYVIATGLKFLTPTDLLGKHLVKAIEEGYTPLFEGDDDLPEGIFDIALADGYIMREVDTSRSWGASSKAIAYKPSQPSIESKILAEKVSYDLKPIQGTTLSNHEFHDMMEAHSRLHHICSSGNLTLNQDEIYSEFLSFLRGNK